MYAIVDIAGNQFKVEKDQELLVPKIDSDVGKSIEFEQVLLVSNKGKVSVGQPFIDGAKVKAEILGATRGEKVVVFKKKRRKGYEVKRGHRQDFTSVKIKSITAK
ncbi:50S ribosomal protein L21 [bacterium]|nr:50S ribosomal protein L21 [bacterium]